MTIRRCVIQHHDRYVHMLFCWLVWCDADERVKIEIASTLWISIEICSFIESYVDDSLTDAHVKTAWENFKNWRQTIERSDSSGFCDVFVGCSCSQVMLFCRQVFLCVVQNRTILSLILPFYFILLVVYTSGICVCWYLHATQYIKECSCGGIRVTWSSLDTMYNAPFCMYHSTFVFYTSNRYHICSQNYTVSWSSILVFVSALRDSEHSPNGI